MALPEAAPAAAQPQTVVLRVSIHCHGCKKKVRKVLRSIQGVQNVVVDSAQHKVTVTGTVDADTLVKRLYKSGKQAVPWHQAAAVAKNPEPAPAAPDAMAPAAPAGDGGKDVAAAEKAPEEQAAKQPQVEASEKKPEQKAAAPEKTPEAEKETESGKKAEKEEAKKGESESEASAADEDEASEKKKNPKDAGESAAAERSLPRSLPPAAKHAHEEYYPYYPPQPQPVLSYQMTQPTASVSYYAARPEAAYSVQQQPPAYSGHEPQPQPMQQWSPSYLHMPYQHAAPEYYQHDPYSPPGTHYSPPPPQQPLHDSYRIFDDENPNACSVM